MLTCLFFFPYLVSPIVRCSVTYPHFPLSFYPLSITVNVNHYGLFRISLVMSSDPVSIPVAPTPTEPSSAHPPFPDPVFPALTKPLLNPLQSEGTPPASTIVEPPRSPNPANPATDDRGTNVEAGIGSEDGGSLAPAEEDVFAKGEDGSSGQAPPPPEHALPRSPILFSPQAQVTLDPLPPNAPMPPTPKAQDEPPPVLAAGDIPPTVAAPVVITAEDREAKGDGSTTPAAVSTLPNKNQDILPDAFPTPVGTSFDPIGSSGPVPTSSDMHVNLAPDQAGGQQSGSGEPMEVDAVGEEDSRLRGSSAVGMESSTSMSSLKRAGEDLEGRDEKRVKEDGECRSGSAVQASVPPPAAFDGAAPAAVLPWNVYVPPPPRPAGPTTPLTITQHKHLLNAVRSLKKAKDAPGFLVPVDTVLFGIPHYHQVVTKPMDLGTVETKLFVSDPRGPPKDKSRMNKWDMSKGSYISVSEVVEDVRQIWENTRKFNGPDHIVSQSASRLEDTFEKLLNNMPAEVSHDCLTGLQSRLTPLSLLLLPRPLPLQLQLHYRHPSPVHRRRPLPVERPSRSLLSFAAPRMAPIPVRSARSILRLPKTSHMPTVQSGNQSDEMIHNCNGRVGLSLASRSLRNTSMPPVPSYTPSIRSSPSCPHMLPSSSDQLI